MVGIIQKGTILKALFPKRFLKKSNFLEILGVKLISKIMNIWRPICHESIWKYEDESTMDTD